MDCGDLENPENGAVSLAGTTILSVATYSCDFGFFFVGGDQVRTCQTTGTWSGTEPTCLGEKQRKQYICYVCTDCSAIKDRTTPKPSSKRLAKVKQLEHNNDRI